MFLRELVQALHHDVVPYCIVGGLAVNLHGIPRTTYDVDIVVATTADGLSRAAVCLLRLGLAARLPVRLEDFASAEYRREMLEERNLIAVTFSDPKIPLREVDVLVNPPIAAERLIEGAVVLDFAGIPVRVVSRADLIAMKEASGRQQDLADVVHLKRSP
jgi:hypothetical protein